MNTYKFKLHIYNLVFTLFLIVAKTLTQVSYKYDSRTLTHSVYVSCVNKVKKIPLKIIDGNITLTTTLTCKSSEHKGYSFIYPVFTRKIKLLWRVKTRIHVKTIYLKPTLTYYNNIKRITTSLYYKTNFLLNYLFLIFIIALLYTTIKIIFLLNIKMRIIILIIVTAGTVFLFSKVDIYYIEKSAYKFNNFALGYKVFGGSKSQYNFNNNSFYIYPISGKLTLNLDKQFIRLNTLKNIFIIYNYKKAKVLVKWKNS